MNPTILCFLHINAISTLGKKLKKSLKKRTGAEIIQHISITKAKTMQPGDTTSRSVEVIQPYKVMSSLIREHPV